MDSVLRPLKDRHVLAAALIVLVVSYIALSSFLFRSPEKHSNHKQSKSNYKIFASVTQHSKQQPVVLETVVSHVSTSSESIEYARKKKKLRQQATRDQAKYTKDMIAEEMLEALEEQRNAASVGVPIKTTITNSNSSVANKNIAKKQADNPSIASSASLSAFNYNDIILAADAKNESEWVSVIGKPAKQSRKEKKSTDSNKISSSRSTSQVEDNSNSGNSAIAETAATGTNSTAIHFENNALTSGCNSTSQTVTVELKQLGKIVGSKGTKLIALQEAYEVEIQVPKAPTGATATITVTGNTIENVNKVIRGITELATKGYSGVLVYANDMIAKTKESGGSDAIAAGSSGGAYEDVLFMERSMQLPNSIIPAIVGKGGLNIKAFKERVGCEVNIQQAAGANTANGNSKITFAGTKKQVNEAKSAIKFLMEYHYSPIITPDTTHLEIDRSTISPDYYNVIIGSGGSEIRHIQNFYGVSIHIPQTIPSTATTTSNVIPNPNLLIVGTKDAIASAQSHIMKLVSAAQNRYLTNYGVTKNSGNSGGNADNLSGDYSTNKEDDDEEADLDPVIHQYMRKRPVDTNSNRNDNSNSSALGNNDASNNVFAAALEKALEKKNGKKSNK